MAGPRRRSVPAGSIAAGKGARWKRALPGIYSHLPKPWLFAGGASGTGTRIWFSHSLLHACVPTLLSPSTHSFLSCVFSDFLNRATLPSVPHSLSSAASADNWYLKVLVFAASNMFLFSIVVINVS